MRIVKIFIASSIVEFEEERIYIGDFVRRFNLASIGQGIQIRLFLCEDEYISSQQIYDRHIRQSDIFIALIGRSLGEITRYEILNVADQCDTIRRKIMVLTHPELKDSFNLGCKSKFQFFIFERNLLDSLITTIKDIVYSLLSEIEDVSLSDIHPIQNTFFLRIPSTGDIESAVIGNIIRRFIDQGNGIITSYDHTPDTNAHVALLSSDYQHEVQQIVELRNAGITPEAFWIFVHQQLLATSDTQKIKAINTLQHYLEGMYFGRFQSYQVLSTIFYNKLLSALIRHNLLDGSGFVYVVRDHWLMRKGNNSLNYSNNLLNTGLDPESEEQARRERVIVNLLNYYWLKGNTEKHIKALEALGNANYRFFVYAAEELEELLLKHSDYNQAVIDFIYDKLELLQLQVSHYSEQEMLSIIHDLINLPENERVRVTSKDVFLIYAHAANILLYYNSQLPQAYRFLVEAWHSFQGIPDPELKIVEYVKSCIIRLCHISVELSLDEETEKWILEAESLCDENDTWYQAVVLMEKLSLYRNYDSLKEYNTVRELAALFQPSFYDANNTNLHLFLLYNYWCVWADLDRIHLYKSFIASLINNYYKPYLSTNSHYRSVGISLCSLAALSENNIDYCNEILESYDDERKLEERSIDYYNLLFVKAIILKNLKLTEESINLFVNLSRLYRGKRDKAGCLQNAALCYMTDYKEKESLLNAEKTYLEALNYYQEINDRYYVGNVYDGLSFCCILQLKYTDAEQYAKKSIDVSEYDCINKHSNYISALLCQGLFDKASEYYEQQDNQPDILAQIKTDFDNEISTLNIGVSEYLRFFEKYETQV